MYHIYFRTFDSDEVQSVETDYLYTAQILWDRLSDSHYMISNRP